MVRVLVMALAALPVVLPTTALADDSGVAMLLVGAGARTAPAYPGAGRQRFAFAPEFEIWRSDEPFPAEPPDEGIGVALIGERGRFAAGPTAKFAPRRKRGDVSGLRRVGFGIEAGGFAEAFLAPNLRARAEARQAIGSHRGMVAEATLDAVQRDRSGQTVATVGPRLRWGSGRHHRRLFGVSALEASASGLAAFQPDAGIYAVGMTAGAHRFIGPRWGVYAFAGYDRLTGDAARSPVVRRGSRDQFTAGLALTHRFRL